MTSRQWAEIRDAAWKLEYGLHAEFCRMRDSTTERCFDEASELRQQLQQHFSDGTDPDLGLYTRRETWLMMAIASLGTACVALAVWAWR